MKSEKTYKNIALIILVWNEIEAIQKIWDQIPFNMFEEIIFVDPGSTDGTIEFIRSKNFPIYIQKKYGRGNAFIESSMIVKSDYIIFFSGDGNEDPKDIVKVAEYLDSGFDVVIAGRYLLKGAKTDVSDDMFLLRKYIPILFGIFANLVWKTGVRDIINGLRGFKKESLIKMNLDSKSHGVELQSTIRARKLNLKIKEFATVEHIRAGGKRKNTAGSLRLGMSLSYYLIREIWVGNKFTSPHQKRNID